MQLIFAGTPEFSAHHLQSLIDSDHQVLAVYTQPDRRAGRGKKLLTSPVKQLAQQHKLPILQPRSLKDAEAQRQLAEFGADLMVVVAYGLLLPAAVLATPRFGCVNVHASLLPSWRGAAPIQRAIAAGDTRTGITIMQIDVGLDTGDMLLKVSCDISEEDTAASLQNKLMSLGAPALLKVLDLIERGEQHPEAQDDALASYARKLSKEEGRLDWQLPASELHNRVRAFNPFPVAFFEQAGDRVRVWKTSANPCARSEAVAGTIVSADAQGIEVACGEGTLCLLELQLPGKKTLTCEALLNGYGSRFRAGTRL